MNQIIKKIAVIGGTGKSGKYLVKELLNQGYHSKLLLRHPEQFSIQSPLIEIVKGDARNYEAVVTLLQGCDLVLSTLGQPKGELSIFSQATSNVIRAMESLSLKRYIVTTGLNVNTPDDHKNEKNKAATEWMLSHYPETTLDKQKEYELLVQSTIDWTLIRLPMIEQTDERRSVQVSLSDCPGDKISAADLAYFIVSQINDTTYVKKAPFIGNV